VTLPGRPKSISREETFGTDISSADGLHNHLRMMSADVTQRLRAGGWRARTVTLKLRYGDFTMISRQAGLAAPTDGERTVHAAAQRLLDAEWSGAPVRLLGVGLSGVEENAQLDLLGVTNDRDAGLDHALDRLRDRFGSGIVQRGPGSTLRDLDVRGDDVRRLAGDDGEDREGGVPDVRAGRARPPAN
jgi:DNA polymerase-4